MRYAILSKEGLVVQCELHEWARWFEHCDTRIIQQDYILNHKVSTVFTGLNNQYFGGPPLWFETMVFGPKHKTYSVIHGGTWFIRNELLQERYSTFKEAKAGHARALEWLVDRLDLSRDYQLQLTDKETDNETDSESIVNRSFPEEDPSSGNPERD